MLFQATTSAGSADTFGHGEHFLFIPLLHLFFFFSCFILSFCGISFLGRSSGGLSGWDHDDGFCVWVMSSLGRLGKARVSLGFCVLCVLFFAEFDFFLGLGWSFGRWGLVHVLFVLLTQEWKLSGSEAVLLFVSVLGSAGVRGYGGNVDEGLVWSCLLFAYFGRMG